jgi:DNA helicase INO80
MYHSTVMQRPEEEADDPRREGMNGASSSNTRPSPYQAQAQQAPARSPTQTDFHSPYSPTNGSHPPRPQFNNPYHPPTPAPLPMPAAAHITGPPASPRTLTAPSAYQSDYQPVPRDKPTSNYYDPTSDSSERRPSESAGWNEGQAPQVPALHEGPNSEILLTSSY